MLTLDSGQRGSCSHQSCCQLPTNASHCMYHLLCASGFPLLLHLAPYVGKHWSLAEKTSLSSHSTADAEQFLKCFCVSSVLSIYLSPLVSDGLNNTSGILCFSGSYISLLLRDCHSDVVCPHTATHYCFHRYFIILRVSEYLAEVR